MKWILIFSIMLAAICSPAQTPDKWEYDWANKRNKQSCAFPNQCLRTIRRSNYCPNGWRGFYTTNTNLGKYMTYCVRKLEGK